MLYEFIETKRGDHKIKGLLPSKVQSDFNQTKRSHSPAGNWKNAGLR